MKVKIAIRLLGNKAPDLDINRLRKWQSDIWELHDGRIDTLPLNGNSDLDSWGYSDQALAASAPAVAGADVTLYILNVPVEDNFFFRRLAKSTACISLFEIAEIMRGHNIPIENVVLRMAYSSALIYSRKGSLPPMLHVATLAHHETKGCIFDLAGIKSDIVFSTTAPRLCDSCRQEASDERVTNEVLRLYDVELSRVRKRLYFRIADVVKRHPIWTLIISTVFALVIGVMSSLAASMIYDHFKARSAQPAGGADVAPAAGATSAHP